MEAGYKLAAGGRLDVMSDRATRRVVLEYRGPGSDEGALPLVFALTPSESRAIAYALTGASNEL
jgi:hypothetical protein